MQLTRDLATRPATPEAVLEMLRADYRLRAAVDPEVDDGADLTRETTVAEWRTTCDLVAVRRLTRFFNTFFDLDLSTVQLVGVLEPERRRTLGEVADWLAPPVRLPLVEPFATGGTHVLGVGAFVALRSLLARAGIPVEHVRPSTPLASLARRHLGALSHAATKLAPSALPSPTIVYHPAERLAAIGAVLGVALVAWGSLTAHALARSVGFGAFVLALIMIGLLARLPPRAVSFGAAVTTIGDLARVIARHKHAGA